MYNKILPPVAVKSRYTMLVPAASLTKSPGVSPQNQPTSEQGFSAQKIDSQSRSLWEKNCILRRAKSVYDSISEKLGLHKTLLPHPILEQMQSADEDLDQSPYSEIDVDTEETRLVEWTPTIHMPMFQTVYSSRDLIKFLRSPFLTWLDHYHLIDPTAFAKNPEKTGITFNDILKERGIAHEEEQWQLIKQKYIDAGKENAIIEIPQTDEDLLPELSDEFVETLTDDELESSTLPRAELQEPRRLSSDYRFEKTLQAMRDGKEVIYQGYLKSNDGKWVGIADILIKVPNPPGVKSRFGDYHYEVQDIKLAKQAKVDHYIQLMLYADFLEQMQGVRPKKFSLINGNGDVLEDFTDHYFDYYKQLKDLFDEYHGDFVAELENMPEIPKQRDYGVWSRTVTKILREKDSLAQVANMRNLQILRLRDADIWTMNQLAETKLNTVPGIPEATFEKLKKQAKAQVRSRGSLQEMALTAKERQALQDAKIHYIKDLYETNLESLPGLTAKELDELKEQAALWVEIMDLKKPFFQVNQNEDEEKGLNALPPSSQNDIFFDIEGYMHEEGENLEYLLGNTYIDYSENEKGEIKFKAFWAHSWEEEKKAFEDLIDWFVSRQKEDPNMHIYHYASYEITAIKRLAVKYATREREVDELLNSGVFVDLYRVVRQGLTVGTKSYSLKDIEKLYRSQREAEVTNALGSVEAYHEWRMLRKEDPEKAQKILDDIEIYNKDDTDSTYELASFLWELKAKIENERQQEERRLAQIREKNNQRMERWLKERGLYDLWQKRQIRKAEAEQEVEDVEDDVEEEIKKENEELKKYLERLDQVRVKLENLKSRDNNSEEQNRIFDLMIHLIDFHWREAKPVLWAKQHRHEMMPHELVEDMASLGETERIIGAPFAPPRKTGLFFSSVSGFSPEVSQRRTQDLPEGFLFLSQSVEAPKNSRSQFYEFRVHPDTFQKLENKTYSFGVDGEQNFEIVDLDESTHTVTLKFGPKIWEFLDEEVPTTLQVSPKRVKSLVFTYRFDPLQDTKITKGDTCFFANDLSIRCKVENIDFQNGFINLKIGPKALAKLEEGPPVVLGLIPDEYVSAKPIQESILKILERFVDDDIKVGNGNKHYLPPVLINFLKKAAPKIKGKDYGVSLDTQRQDVISGRSQEYDFEEIYSSVKNLDHSTLFLQGIPGGGKTYTAAKAIVRLLKESRGSRQKIRIGLTGPNHNAIINLLEMVNQLAEQEGVKFDALKIGDDFLHDIFENDHIKYMQSAGQIKARINNVEIVAGTTWAFSHDDFENKFDYLFIDEASQMPVANVFAMSRATQNMVVLGDQTQLQAIFQGSHPGESGLSALEYYLDDESVIPPEKGFFLGMSRRNHPDIADVYSEVIYDGQARAHPQNEKQKIKLPEDDSQIRRINQETGFTYVPVEHQGNTHKSEEEAAAVKEIVQELVGREFVDAEGRTRKLTLKDIMIISPYALQAKQISKELGGDARVGTVHKFQGQEAPVTIVSFAVSKASSYSRSMDHWANLSMLHTAVSRARGLVVFVGSPELENIRVRHIRHMRQLNFYYKILRIAGWKEEDNNE